MYSTFTASTVWKREMPRLIQRRAPLTVLPRPGTNTTSSRPKQASSSNWLYCSMFFSSVRIAQIARPTPPARNSR
ncbi:hypothetical protein NB689_002946 [Xanthomonas sacchari]|nr:hypothetical protein [Xanthomonas sacchari]